LSGKVFFFKGLQVLKDLLVVVNEVASAAFLMKQPHQAIVIRTFNYILISVSLDVSFL